jgi:hypothetical protein
MRFSKNKIRQQAYAKGFRSGLEDKLSEQFKSLGIAVEYETDKIPYVVPASNHKYTPDFKLPNGTYIESKGKWDASDRKKHVLIKEQHPELTIRFIFSNPNAKISKRSKTSYGDICEKYGWEYIHWGTPIPEHWYL